jgi:2-iminobutanoate/2-iminopropanoate deaminase
MISVADFEPVRGRPCQSGADIRMRYLGVATPTSTTVGITRLIGPDFMIEIEAVAVINS